MLAFCVAIVWLDLAANELVNVASAIGLIWDVEPSLLGSTLLAWGNSVREGGRAARLQQWER